MQDLRVRLGLILALALLPLLVFAMWSSYDDYGNDTRIRAENTQLSARIAVSDIVDSLSNSRAVLRFSASLVSRENCQLDMANIAREYPRFHNVIQTDAQGRVQCSARKVRDDGTNSALIASRLTPEEPFNTQILSFSPQGSRPQTILVTAYGIFKQGDLIRVFAATEDIQSLERLIGKAEPSEGDQVAVFDQFGRLLVGNWRSGDLETFAQSTPAQYFTGSSQGVDTLGRRVSVMPTSDEQIFVALASPKQNFLSWNKFNPLSSAMVPFLAWIFGFGAIWLSTDQLILTHLRKMRSATLAFAKGDRDVRVGDLNNPPASIDALGKNFDMMADRIAVRESTIQDALEEKDTLLREIHHRVKNNLQIIISLLNMQERKLKDNQAVVAIRETRSRINAIALVHRGLYENKDLRHVNMQKFLERLVLELTNVLGLRALGIDVSTVSECEPMEADMATPVALFVVEALTNSVKHGVPGGGRIDINLSQNRETILVHVSDSGQSQPENAKAGTGTKLMQGFARQLGGKLAIEKSAGEHVTTLTFKIRPPKKI